MIKRKNIRFLGVFCLVLCQNIAAMKPVYKSNQVVVGTRLKIFFDSNKIQYGADHAKNVKALMEKAQRNLMLPVEFLTASSHEGEIKDLNVLQMAVLDVNKEFIAALLSNETLFEEVRGKIAAKLLEIINSYIWEKGQIPVDEKDKNYIHISLFNTAIQIFNSILTENLSNPELGGLYKKCKGNMLSMYRVFKGNDDKWHLANSWTGADRNKINQEYFKPYDAIAGEQDEVGTLSSSIVSLKKGLKALTGRLKEFFGKRDDGKPGSGK